jgi:TonB family protein
MNRGSWIAGCVLSLLAATCALHGQAAQPGGGIGPGGVAGMLDEAQRLEADHQMAAAARQYQAASQAAQGRCAKCLLGLARGYRFLSGVDIEAAIDATRRAIELLTDPRAVTPANAQLGTLLLMKPGPEAGVAAEAAFAKAVAGGPAMHAELLVGLAEARVRQGHYSSAIEAANEALAAAPAGTPTALQARSAICVARRHLSPPQSSRAGDVLRVGGPVTGPKKLFAPPPTYTEMARQERLQGKVVLGLIVGRDGCVEDAHVYKGLSMSLDDAAVAAAEQWLFEPAKRDGKPVRIYYTVSVSFQAGAEQPPAAPGPG